MVNVLGIFRAEFDPERMRLHSPLDLGDRFWAKTAHALLGVDDVDPAAAKIFPLHMGDLVAELSPV